MFYNIVKMIRDQSIDFDIKYRQILSIIRSFTEKHFNFYTYSDDQLNKLYDIELCREKSEFNQSQSYCVQDKNELKLLIPELNLYTNEQNFEKYTSDFTYDLIMNYKFQKNDTVFQLEYH